MKLKHGIVSLIMLLGFNQPTFAMKSMVLEGGRVGNGGGLVVCRDDNRTIQSVELLDYYEARSQRGFKLTLTSLSGDYPEQTAQLIQRLARVSPLRLEIYTNWLSTFEAEANFLKDVQFSTIPDSGHVAVPKGCGFEQGLIQTAPRFAGDKRYFVNDELWQKMNASQRAGLLLHEFLYREALGYGHEDSISVRYLTGFITDEKFSSVQTEKWITTLQNAHFEMTDFLLPDLNIEVTVDLKKIWKPAPESTTTYSPVMKHSIPLLIGTCQIKGCEEYEADSSYLNETSEQNKEYPLYLAAMLIRYDGNEIKIKAPRLGLKTTTVHLEVYNGRGLMKIAPHLTSISAPPIIMNLVSRSGKTEADAEMVQFLSHSEGNAFFERLTASSFKGRHYRTENAHACKRYELTFNESEVLTLALAPAFLQPTNDLLTGARCGQLGNSMIVTQSKSPELSIDLEQRNAVSTFDPQTGAIESGGFIASMVYPNFRYLCVDGREVNGCIRNQFSPNDGVHYQTHGKVSMTFHSGFIILPPQYLELNSVGAPRSAVISNEVELMTSNGTMKKFEAGSTVYFDEEGNVKP